MSAEGGDGGAHRGSGKEFFFPTSEAGMSLKTNTGEKSRLHHACYIIENKYVTLIFRKISLYV
jgi:hypothetical protein